MDYEKEFMAFFHESADQSRQIALKHFRQSLSLDEKEDKTPVTEADREIEKAIRSLINSKFPTHGIIGEEYGKENDSAEFVWVIDPIDGTKSFATGRPLFGTVIGLLHQGRPVVGLIDQAFTQERWLGITNQTATHNGKILKVASPRNIENVRLYTGGLDMFKGEHFDGYLRLCNAVKWTQYSCDCYSYGLLAMGWVDLVVEQRLKIYDIAGVVPIITGAGGYIRNWDGSEIDVHTNGQIVAASSEKLAMDALSIIEQNVSA